MRYDQAEEDIKRLGHYPAVALDQVGAGQNQQDPDNGCPARFGRPKNQEAYKQEIGTEQEGV